MRGMQNRQNLNHNKEAKIADRDLLHIEALLNLIPYAGGFLATYFGEIRARRIQERMNKYINYFIERLKTIQEEKIDKEYMKSEDRKSVV